MGICLDTDQRNDRDADEYEYGQYQQYGHGKVTHCDNLMQERRGVTHINMTDLLQQYSVGNEMQDFAQLSSKTVTEVLMLEMKMAPGAKTYLVSGYPRSMRDVVEYSNKDYAYYWADSDGKLCQNIPGLSEMTVW
ncbi:hypothetical protein FOCC_FOCC007010 [Frankliniella occidentalis]|nr:hypothetical protein FOCC_FOCC007010 [Frankliniella occidentalis]